MPWEPSPAWADHTHAVDAGAATKTQPSVWTSGTATVAHPLWFPPSAADIEDWVATLLPRFPTALAARARRLNSLAPAAARRSEAAVSANGAIRVDAGQPAASAAASDADTGSDDRGAAALTARVQVLEELVAQLSAEVMWLKAKTKAKA